MNSPLPAKKPTSDPAASCPVVIIGTDNHIGDYCSAPCGWSTYNREDISHREWHRRHAPITLKGLKA